MRASFEQRASNVMLIDIVMPQMASIAKFFLSSDVHFDSPHCNRELLREHMAVAASANAPVLLFGDVFDVMATPKDPRMEYEGIRQEYAGRNDILNAIAEDFAEFFSPFLGDKKIPALVLGTGNHESALQRKLGVDVRQLAKALLPGNRVFLMGYSGWVIFRAKVNRTKRDSLTLYYHHGRGGSAPVTKGVIDVNRQGTYIANVDIVVNGHSHTGYYVPERRVHVTPAGIVKTQLLSFLRTPGYKESGILGGSFEEEKIPQLKPQGGFMLSIFPKNDKSGFALHHRITPMIWG